MSEIDSELDASKLDETVEQEPANTPRSETPSKHEAANPNESEQLPDLISTTESVTGNVAVPESTNSINHSVDQQPEATSITVNVAHPPVNMEAKEGPDVEKQAATKIKPSVSIKPPANKMNGGPSTPLVKRIINSGTFGAGTVKTASSKSAAPTQPPTATAALKKSTSTSSAPSKTPMASSRPAASSTAPPNRRLSVAPAKSAAPPSKPSLSASANTKPAPSSNTNRASMVSPASSVTSASRPRAPVSEGVKRTPLATTRQSISAGMKPPLTTSTKPPPTRSSDTTGAKPSRSTPSISSIREAKGEGKTLEDIQSQLNDASESLARKTETIMHLENQVVQLTNSLETIQDDIVSKDALLRQLEQDKLLLEEQLTESTIKLESERGEENSVLASLKQDLDAAKTSSITQTELVDDLRAQTQSLEMEITSLKTALETLQASTSSDANIASVEHEAFLKAQANSKSIAAEAEALKEAHAKALQEAYTKLKDLEAKAGLVDDLNFQITSLKAQREESAGKISELEVDILELKETQETIEEDRDRSLLRIQTLEEELLRANSTAQQAIKDIKTKELEFATQIDAIHISHSEALKHASEEQSKVAESLENATTELASALAVNEFAKADALVAVENHARKLAEAEQVYSSKLSELSDEIKRITAELEDQEAHYNNKVDAVKNEHSRLLQEAFERAKNEAGTIHAQELQAFRVESAASIEQLRAANQSAIENLKAEHTASFDAEVSHFEKVISTLKLDLKATQEDLAKAKAALESSRIEVETLKKQRDNLETSTSLAAETSPTHIEEVARLTKELSNTKDDLAAVTEMLDLTKASLREMSNNQSKELEEAARIRAEEITKLRISHNEEVTTLATQKSELLTRLSDLEGELATLKATITTESVPKNNGNGTVPPSSPGVTKEELRKTHEAHNLKIHDIRAEHEKSLKILRDKLEVSEQKTTELQQEVTRKAMEIQYLEQDQEDSQEQITRLKEDLDTMTERLSREQPAVP